MNVSKVMTIKINLEELNNIITEYIEEKESVNITIDNIKFDMYTSGLSPEVTGVTCTGI